MNPAQKSLYALHMAVMLLGVTALFSKIIPLSALDITFARAVIACVCLFTLVRLWGEHFRLHSGRDYLVAILLGALMATHWVTYFASMQFSSVSVGMIALFTFPVITVLLEPFFENIRLVWQDVVSALVVFCGIFLIVPEISLDNDVTMGILVGVFSGFGVVTYDLIEPFQGLYQISNTVNQLYTLRNSLKVAVCATPQERKVEGTIATNATKTS